MESIDEYKDELYNGEGELDEYLIASSEQKIATGVWVRRIKKHLQDDYKFLDFEEPPKEEMVIIIKEETTIENIRNAWFTICQERNNLRRKQGSDLEASGKDLLHELYITKCEGSSHADIAHDLNFDLAMFLFALLLGAGEKNATTLLLGEHGFMRILRFADSSTIGWEELIDEAEENIRNTKAPWSPNNGPIDRYFVINKLRKYQQDLETGKIILEQNIPESFTNRMYESIHNQGYLFMFVVLLKSTYPDDFEKYKSRFKKRFSKFIDNYWRKIDIQ